MLNEKIKSLRQSYRLNQVELGKALGVTKQCVSNWENDNIQPSVEMLVKLAKFFNVSADYLLDIDESRTIDVSGLDDETVAHIKMIIEDIRRREK